MLDAMRSPRMPKRVAPTRSSTRPLSPEERARRLLEADLGAAQKEDLALHGEFSLVGSRGGVYVVQPSQQYEVVRAWPPPVMRLGFYPVLYEYLPPSDIALAKKLSIEADEDLIRSIACKALPGGFDRARARRARRRHWRSVGRAVLTPNLPLTSALDLRRVRR